MYRFEKDDKATGLIYNQPATGSAKWLDETKTLAFAYNSVAGSTILALLAGVTVLAF